MVEFNLKVHPEQRLAYIPRQIVKELGTNLKILCGARAFVAHPQGEDPEIILRSLAVIIEDLKLRASLKDSSTRED